MLNIFNHNLIFYEKRGRCTRALCFCASVSWCPKIERQHQHPACLVVNCLVLDADVFHLQTVCLGEQAYKMCWFGISEPRKNFDWCELYHSVEINIKTREAGAPLCSHKLVLIKTSFKQERLWNQAFSLFSDILFFLMLMKGGRVCLCSISLSLSLALFFLF